MRKIKVILTLIVLIPCFMGYSQKIDKIAYSLDAFEKENEGIVIDVNSDKSHLDTLLKLPVSDLSPGIHNLYIRSLNSDGVWSFPVKQTFYIPEKILPKNLVAIEYSINTVEKEGEGIPLPLNEYKSVIDTNYLIDIKGLQPGINEVYFRTKNDLGIWSFPVKSSFYISEPDTTHVVSIKYRVYNDYYDSEWITSVVNPSRKEVDTVLHVSTNDLEIDSSYTLEVFAVNNKELRGYSVFTNAFTLRANNAPMALHNILEVQMMAADSIFFNMDTLFNDIDIPVGDSLMYKLVKDVDIVPHFLNWDSIHKLSVKPLYGDAGSYTFWIKATDKAGVSDSLQVNLTVEEVVGIGTNTYSQAFKVYPNPTQSKLTISIEKDADNFTYKLFSLQGRILLSGNSEVNEKTLELRHLPKGMYYLQVMAGGKLFTEQIILQ